MKFLLSVLVATVAVQALGADTACVDDDDVSLLQVEQSLTDRKPQKALVDDEEYKAPMFFGEHKPLASFPHLDQLEKYEPTSSFDMFLTQMWGYPILSAEASKLRTKELINNNTTLANGLLLLDTCPMNEVYVSMVAAFVSLAVFLSSSLVILTLFDFGTEDTLRKKFHATRLIPWIYLGILAGLSIPLTMFRMAHEHVRFSHIVTACVPTLPVFVVTQFACLLIYDLIWVCGVFRSCAKKPLLLLHHAGYLFWSFATLYWQVGYMNLVCIVIGFEELPELAASISYLKKNGKHGRWWLIFTIAFRMCCSAYAIGATMLFILLGYSGWQLKAFLWFDIFLWVGFVYQEWEALTELTPMVAGETDALKKVTSGLGHIFPVGCKVKGHSLSTPGFNGVNGKVRGTQDDRVRVLFENGSQKLLRPENLEHVHENGNKDTAKTPENSDRDNHGQSPAYTRGQSSADESVAK